jgi:hypothetical protein
VLVNYTCFDIGFLLYLKINTLIMIVLVVVLFAINIAVVVRHLRLKRNY